MPARFRPESLSALAAALLLFLGGVPAPAGASVGALTEATWGDSAQVSLDGTWAFRLDPGDAGTRENWGASPRAWADWEPIRVPSTWEDAGHPGYDGIAWYAIRITVHGTPPPARHRAILFRGVDDNCTVWVNGRRARGNQGWNTPFLVDVTGRAGDGDTLEVAVRVEDTGLGGGIHRPVSLAAYDAADELGVIDWTVPAVASPDWVRDAVLYEIFPRDYGPNGTLDDITADLDRLQVLGVNVLWLMPVQPLGREHRKGTFGSPYSIRDYRAVNPELGTLADMRRLVTEAHARGMRVILDWVANHTAWDNPLTVEHPEWFTRDASGKLKPPVADWWDVVDLDYDAPGLRSYMIESMRFWITEAGIDGFRCDVAGMVPLDFWERARRELTRTKPDLMLLAEGDGGALQVKAFDLTYDWAAFRAFREVCGGRMEPPDLLDGLLQGRNGYPRGALRMRFLENHDEARAAKSLGPDCEQAALAFLFTAPGVPLLYAGQEAGATARPSLFEREPVDWEHGDPSLASFISQLAHVRRARNALTHGQTLPVATDRPDAVVSFVRWSSTDTVLAAVNFSAQPVEFRFRDGQLAGKTAPDLLSGRRVILDSGRPVTLPPYGALAVPVDYDPDRAVGAVTPSPPEREQDLAGLFQGMIDSLGAGDADSAGIYTPRDLLVYTDSVAVQVADLCGLPFKRPVPSATWTQENLRDRIREEFRSDRYAPGQLDRIQAELAVLGAIPPGYDLVRAYTEAAATGVGGIYDPETGVYHLIEQPGMVYDLALGRMTMAHELTHALDDQYVSLDSLMTVAAGVQDREFVVQAVVEGAATAVMSAYASMLLTRGEVDLVAMMRAVKSQIEGMQAFAEAPAVLRASVAAYTEGQTFVLRGKPALDPGAARRATVNFLDLARDLPRSSEQVLHPEKYWDPAHRDDPVTVDDAAVEPLFRTLSLEVLNRDTLGEIYTALLLDPDKVGRMVGPGGTGAAWTVPAAEGWGGDRLYLLGPAGTPPGTTPPLEELRALWLTTWDTPRDREEFMLAVNRVAMPLPRQVVALGDRSAAVLLNLDAGRTEALVGPLTEMPTPFTRDGAARER